MRCLQVVWNIKNKKLFDIQWSLHVRYSYNVNQQKFLVPNKNFQTIRLSHNCIVKNCGKYFGYSQIDSYPQFTIINLSYLLVKYKSLQFLQRIIWISYLKYKTIVLLLRMQIFQLLIWQQCAESPIATQQYQQQYNINLTTIQNAINVLFIVFWYLNQKRQNQTKFPNPPTYQVFLLKYQNNFHLIT
eukprot:TRINITY_DN1246_c1_g1_i2.p3 TRINITY_DN1246_c1_g1~~TRINITY_DN1246_c1_g1_i2.p3  ORF type:complete len:187 (+),score=-12.99 TRINITY_DN1246_c1_g1_i2:215-775(+)